MLKPFVTGLVGLLLLLSPASGQSPLGLGGSSTTTLDGDVWIDPLVPGLVGLDIFGSAPAGSNVTIYFMERGQWPFGPVFTLGPIIASPGSNYWASFLLPPNVNLGPLVVVAVAHTPAGTTQVSAAQVAHVRVQPPCATLRSGSFFVGRNASDQEVVRIKVIGCPGDVITVKDPSGAVRATYTVPAGGGSFTYDQPNDHPGNADWAVDVDSGNGPIPFLGN